jgi:hypothetical protein
MESFFQSLESRTMLSAAPSVGALKSEGKVVVADTVALGKVLTADLVLVKADLKAADETKSSKALVSALSVEGTKAFAVTSAGVAKTITLIASDVTKLVAAAGTLAKHPTNTIDAAKVTADDNTLGTDASNRLAVITNDLTDEYATNTTNLDAILTANPSNTKLATDASTTISDISGAARTALTESTTTALTTDVAAVIAAFPG